MGSIEDDFAVSIYYNYVLIIIILGFYYSHI